MTTIARSVDIERLRREHYNATVTSIRLCHEELMVIRVRPDRGIPRFKAGQYTVLGLGYWEPRVPGCQIEPDLEAMQHKVVKRAYSVSSPLIGDDGRLVHISEHGYVEFYITLVRSAVSRPPALTPRLFALRAGDRLLFGPHFHGTYTLEGLPRDANVIFAATGTGEAPHNAMITELLRTQHRGQIVNTTCVRRKRDLGYLETHQRLEAMFPNYHFVALTTREPENLDSSAPGYIGKRYLQQFFASREFEATTDVALDPERTHVFLCGNPEMIGAPLHTHDPVCRYPQPQGMVETLEKMGFQVDRPHERGNIHFERYW